MNPLTIGRRDFLRGAAASAATLALASPAAAAGTAFRFITPFSFSLAFAPVLYAEAAGYYAENGLDVAIEAAQGAAMAAQMVIAGQMDAGRTGGTNYLVSRVNNDAPLISIATIAQISPFFLISSTQEPVQAVADLKGRTVGLASLGGSMEGTLDLLLIDNGIDPKEVRKVKVADNAASFALIEAGRAGAFVGNTSSMILASAARSDVHAIPMDDGMPGQVYVASPAEIEAAPEKFIAFLKATHRSAREIAAAEDLGPVLEKLVGKFTISGASDAELAKRDLETNARNWMARGPENLLRNVPEIWAHAVETLHRADMLDAAPDPTTLYTNALLERAVA
ncbi:ABC transporter substrate-binding protein (plasmid) [Paracoccus sp. MA]|uniref:ABC transporter substrate-binding protein n=1 Tax=Paracoccus sp. MA TaxID=2895796 RepID=UPI001E48375F|nr:ABC transporter substrate-binding protein [Paracoccus sp. MA]UFM67013.1 ABC transporter substrate-binding protein [Paracoccus sp. MA]